jgi:hypothetical protein
LGNDFFANFLILLSEMPFMSKIKNIFFFSLLLTLFTGCEDANEVAQISPEAKPNSDLCSEQKSGGTQASKSTNAGIVAFTDVPCGIDSTFIVKESISSLADKARLGVSFEGFDAIPVGFYLEIGESVSLNVKKNSGLKLPKLVIGTYSRYYAPEDKYWQSNTHIQEVQLVEGNNTVTNTTGKSSIFT